MIERGARGSDDHDPIMEEKSSSLYWSMKTLLLINFYEKLIFVYEWIDYFQVKYWRPQNGI